MSCVNLKVVIVGDSGVGKSSLAYAMSSDNGICTKNIDSTVGAGYVRAVMGSPLGGMIGFDIWDTAGQERYRSLVPMYLRGANVVLYVVDDTPESLTSVVEFWQPYTKSIIGTHGISPIHIIIRNKSDEPDRSPGSNQLLMEYAVRMQYDVIGTSATTGVGVKNVLKTIVKKFHGYESEWERGRTPPLTTILRLSPGLPGVDHDLEPPRGCLC